MEISPDSWAIAILGLVSVLAAGLRIYHLGQKALWYDEAVIFWISRGNLLTVIHQNAALNSAPPLYALLISIVSSFGTTEAVLRSVSCLAGILAVPAIFFLARRHMSNSGALTAALLLTVAPVQIRYSQELREYSLSVLFLILLLLAFDVFLERSSWKNAGIAATVIVISLFVQYGLALVVFALNLILLCHLLTERSERKEKAIRWVSIQGISLIAVFVVLQLSLRDQWQPGGFAADDYLSGGYWNGDNLRSAIVFVVSRGKEIAQFAFPGYLFLVLVYAGILVLGISPSKRRLGLATAVIIGIVALAGLARIYPFHAGRQDLFLAPLIYLLAALAIDYLFIIDAKRIIPALFILLMLRKASTLLPTYFDAEGGSGVGSIARELKNIAKPGDPIYVCSRDPVFLYYFGERYDFPENRIVTGIQNTASDPRAYLDQVDDMLESYDRAWLVISRWCGDMQPMLDHITGPWQVDLSFDVEPDEQLYYVH